MKSLRPWQNNEPIRKLKNELDGMFQRFFDEPFFSQPSILNQDNFTPACNIQETKDKYIIEAEIAGVDPYDVEVEVSGNMLTIKGERKQKMTTEDDENQFHIVEQTYGSFYRSFTLPNNIDTETITAEHKNGILSIEIFKKETNDVRKIKIKNQ